MRFNDTSTSSNPAAGRGRAAKPASFLDRVVRSVERFIWPLALLTGVMGIVYWYWTTTPQYALAAVVMSVNNNDTKTFEKYVDIDTITSRAFDDVVDGPARSAIMGRYDSMIGVGFIRFFKNDIVDMAHGKVIDFVATNQNKFQFGKNAGGWLPLPSTCNTSIEQTVAAANTVETPAQTSGAVSSIARSDDEILSGGSAKAEHSDSIGDKLKKEVKNYGKFRGANLHMEGNVALLDLQFYSPKLRENWIAQFKLEDAGGYWRVTQLSNLNQLIDKYITLHAQHRV